MIEDGATTLGRMVGCVVLYEQLLTITDLTDEQKQVAKNALLDTLLKELTTFRDKHNVK